MSTESRDARRWTKWALFVAFFITIPVPYFMVVVGGVVPMFFILFLAVRGLIVALPKFTAEGFWMLGILWANVVILGGILYIVASGTHWFLFRILPQRHAKLILIALIAALFIAASLFDIYRVPGHNHAPPANVFRFIKAIAT